MLLSQVKKDFTFSASKKKKKQIKQKHCKIPGYY